MKTLQLPLSLGALEALTERQRSRFIQRAITVWLSEYLRPGDLDPITLHTHIDAELHTIDNDPQYDLISNLAGEPVHRTRLTWQFGTHLRLRTLRQAHFELIASSLNRTDRRYGFKYHTLLRLFPEDLSDDTAVWVLSRQAALDIARSHEALVIPFLGFDGDLTVTLHLDVTRL